MLLLLLVHHKQLLFGRRWNLHWHGKTHISRHWHHTWWRNTLAWRKWHTRHTRHTRHNRHYRWILSLLLLWLLWHHEHLLLLKLNKCFLLIDSLCYYFLMSLYHLLLLRKEIEELLSSHAQYLIQLPKYEAFEVFIRNTEDRRSMRLTSLFTMEDRLRSHVFNRMLH